MTAGARRSLRPLAVLFLVAVALAAGLVLARDPEEPLAVVGVIAAIAVAAGAAAAMPLLGGARTRRERRAALRRAVLVAAAVALLLALRVVDGLSVITGGFVVLAIVAAEAVLVARPGTPSR